jgi:hypothetical protein
LLPAGEFTVRQIRTSTELDLASRFLQGFFPSRHVTLVGLDEAVGFYERCGYQGRLLLQFTPPARRDEVAPLFADFRLLETHWQDIPQLWVQTPGVDLTLTDRVRGMDGIHAHWAMDRDLAEHPG